MKLFTSIKFICLFLQTTYVLKRSHPLRLLKEGHEHRLKKMNKVYELVEETSSRDAKRKLELILTEDVPKMGKRGDVVHVRKQIGRNKLLATGLAVYASPENRQMFQDRKISKKCELYVTCYKRFACFPQLLVAAPPHTITLPEEPVDRIGSYTFTVTVSLNSGYVHS
uniref:Large ribosomal subunit protein bL9m n=1 Tax=Branchiostoma floridae TaxID=7739 RepID=C3XYT4_BRAFL|eukprot:XP_002610959.1 hypothetical protein BRAFLDRAFT_231456 [Branchiostoma floridae]